MLLLIVTTCAAAAKLTDSLPIEQYFMQQGKQFSRGKVEKFLRGQDSFADLAGGSRAYRLTSGGIAATIWSINLGISIYQFTALYQAIERQEPLVMPLQEFSTPLMIGGEIATFVQQRLSYRSDFLLHKAALKYNRQLQLRRYPDSLFSLKIEKAKFGVYRQDRLFLPDHVVYAVLRENEQSRSLSNWSLMFRETAQPVQAFGAMFLAYALIGFLVPEGVDPRVRSTQLSVGLSLTGFGIINGIVSWAIRKNAIEKYNESVTPSDEQPGIIEERD